MKKWLQRFWPWRKIAELEKALGECNQHIIAANDRYHNAYSDGFRHHLQNWIAQGNIHYGCQPFSDSQNKLMISLYERGHTFREALEYLRVAEGRELYKRFSN